MFKPILASDPTIRGSQLLVDDSQPELSSNAKKTAEPLWVLGIRFLGWYGIPSYCGINIGKPIQSFLGNFPILSLQKIFVSGSPCHASGTIPTNRTEKNPTTFFPPPCWAKFHHKEHKVDPIHGMDLFSVVPRSEVRCSSWEFYWVRYLSPKKIPGTKKVEVQNDTPVFLGRFFGGVGVPWTIRLTSKQLTKVLRIPPF